MIVFIGGVNWVSSVLGVLCVFLCLIFTVFVPYYYYFFFCFGFCALGCGKAGRLSPFEVCYWFVIYLMVWDVYVGVCYWVFCGFYT